MHTEPRILPCARAAAGTEGAIATATATEGVTVTVTVTVTGTGTAIVSEIANKYRARMVGRFDGAHTDDSRRYHARVVNAYRVASQ
jgi:hypothetical protein